VTTDWKTIEDWDRKYYLHNVFAQSEYPFTPVEKVDGNYIYLAGGARLLDFQSQLISDSLGHRHHAPHKAIEKAMQRYGHVFFGMANEYRARAAKLLIEDVIGQAGAWASRVRFLASGTEAVENSISIARLYTGRPIILTQAHSFHGLSNGPTMLRGYRGNMSRGEAYADSYDIPGFPNSGFMPIPAPENASFQAEGRLPSLQATEEFIKAVGPQNIAAVITEPMFGAAGLMPHPDYMYGLYEICKTHKILWIDDEVLCGFGRLGEWFGYQLNDKLYPDMMIVGKGMNASSLPSGGVVLNEEIADFMESGRWWSGSTWDGHPLVCASISGTLEFMLDTKIIDTVKVKSVYLREKLERLQEKHPCIGHIGGAGLYFAVDLVDKNRQPIVKEDRYFTFTGDLSESPNNIISAECAKHGVFLGGFVPNTVKCGPPFTITEEEIDQAMLAFDHALTKVEEKYH
jgi:taurine---2-oxoglutarate transaminase